MPVVGGGSINPYTGLTEKPGKEQPFKMNPVVGGRSAGVNIPQSTTRADIGDYEKYVPGGAVFLGEGLEDARAMGQSTVEQWGRGLTKFVGKTATATLGGTVGALYGVGSMIANGDFKKSYDNEFQQAMDNAGEWMDDKMAIYATEAEKDENFLKSLNNASFWANDVLSGLSFTAGAVLSELVWSAATVATLGALAPGAAAATAGNVARAGRFMKNINKGKDVTKALQAGSNIKIANDAGRIMRQIYTGAGYEAGVEARHHKKQLLDKLEAEYFKANPDATEIPTEIRAEHEAAVNTSGNGVFAMNLGVVGLSHMIALPKIFGPGANSQINAFSAIKRQVKDVGGAWKVAFTPAYKSAGRMEKIARAAYLTGKNPFVEGIWEEGMQGVANRTMLDYTTKKYNAEGTDRAVDFGESFGRGFQETYGGKDGWKEIGIGMIIGLVGSPNFRSLKRNSETKKLERVPGQPAWTGGPFGEFQARKAKRENADSRAIALTNETKDILFDYSEEYAAANPEAVAASVKATENIIRQAYFNEEMDKAIAEGSLFDAKNIESDQVHSYIQSRIDGGYGSSLKGEFGQMVADMSDDEFAQALGYTEQDTDDIPTRRQQTIDKFNKRVDDTIKVTKLVDSNFRSDLSVQSNKDIREALIYAGSTINDVETREVNLTNEIAEETQVQYDIGKRGEQYKESYRKDVMEAIKDRPDVEKAAIVKKLDDLDKIQRRRESYLEQYNRLFTRKGQAEYKRLEEETLKAQEERAIQELSKFYEGTVTVVDRTTQKRYKKYDKSDGTSIVEEIGEDGQPLPNTQEVVNVKSREFLERFALQEGAAPDQRVLNEEESKRLVEKLKSFKDPDDLATFMNEQIRPLKLANFDLVHREAAKQWNKLTDQKLDLSKPVRYVDKTYVRKSDEGIVIVTKDNDKDDTYYVHEVVDGKKSAKQIVMGKAQLDEEYVYKSVWTQYGHKLHRITILEDLINSKIALYETERVEGRTARKRMKELQTRYTELIATLEKQKRDRRFAQKTIDATTKLVDDLQSEIDNVQDIIDNAVQAQIALKQELEYWGKRLEEETESNEIVRLDDKVKAIEEEMKTNNEVISAWGKTINQLKKLINKLLDVFGVAKMYKEQGLDKTLDEYRQKVEKELIDDLSKGGKVQLGAIVKKYRESADEIKKRLTAKKGAVTRAMNRASTSEGEFWATKGKIASAENQIALFEKANEELWEKLYLIEQEVNAINEFYSKKKLTVAGEVNYPQKTEEVNEKTDPETVYQDRNEPPSTVTKSTEERETIWESAKRKLANVFSGLTGRHGKTENGKFIYTDDANQRRYYRFTSSTNVAKGNYRIKIVKAFEEDRDRIVKNKYVFDDTFVAVVIDEDGNYLLENGEVTDKFTRELNVWTSFPLDKLTTSSFGTKENPKAYKPDENDTQGWLEENPGMTVQESKDAYAKDEKALLAQHTQLREKIKAQIESGKEVTFRIIGKSVGIPNDPTEAGESPDHIAIDRALGHDDVTIGVQTLKTLTLDGSVITSSKPGFTFLKDNKTGNVYEARSRKLNPEEITLITNMFRLLVNRSVKSPDGQIHSDDAGILKTANGTVISDNMFEYLSELAFWTGDNFVKDKATGEQVAVNDRDATRFHFTRKNLEGKSIAGSSLQLGNTAHQIFVEDEAGNLLLNPGIADENGEGALKDFLDKKYVNISSSLLRNIGKPAKKKSGEYTQILTLNPETGIVEIEPHTNYQEYLVNTGVLGLSVIPVNTIQKEYDENANEIEEEIPQMLSQYLIYEATDNNAPKTITVERKVAPSTNYDNWSNLKAGSRINVEVRDDTGSVIRTAVLELQSDNSFRLISGEINQDFISRLSGVYNDPNQKGAFEGFKQGLDISAKGTTIAISDVVTQEVLGTPATNVDAIVDIAFTGQGKSLEIEIQGEKKPFLLAWRSGNSKPTLFGEKQEDGSYKPGEGFPSAGVLEGLMIKYLPAQLIDLISDWTTAKNLNQEEIAEINIKNYTRRFVGENATDGTSSETVVTPTAPVKPSVEEGKPINIYAGDNQNAHLSNFAKRPFKVDFIFGEIGKLFPQLAEIDALEKSKFLSEFQSVEHAFQALKALSINNIEQARKIKDAKSAAEAKRLGNKTNLPLTPEQVEAWDAVSDQAMRELIKDSFLANPEALQSLLDTISSELTHTQDKSKWGKLFPALLMSVREELYDQQALQNENAPVAPVKPAPAATPKGRKDRGASNINLYRSPTNDERGLEQISEAEKWFKERFPNIDFNVVQHMIDGKHHGQLRNAAVYIFNNAETGTTYHEAFHVVTQIFLTRRERRALYREHRQRFPEHKNASDTVVEEHLAELFREFVLFQKETSNVSNRGYEKTQEQIDKENDQFRAALSEYSDPSTSGERKAELNDILLNGYYAEGEMISYEAKKAKRKLEAYEAPLQRSFFQKLYDYVVELVFGKPESIIDIFNNIQGNKYRNETPNIRFARDVVFNRTYKNKDEQLGRAAVEGVNFFFFQKLFSPDNRDANIASLFSNENNSQLLNELYDYAYEQIGLRIEQLEGFHLEAIAEKDEVEAAYLENVIEQLRFVRRNWNQAEDYTDPADRAKYSTRGLHRNFLSQYKLEFKNIQDDIVENNSLRDPDNQWANESIKMSSKLNASRNIKLLIGTLVDVYEDQVPKMNIIELPQNVDFGSTFNILANRLSGLNTLDQMSSAIKGILDKAPYLNKLLDRLGMRPGVSQAMTKQEMLEQIQFVQTFAKSRNNYVFDITSENGKFKLVNSNRTSVSSKILQDWQNNAANLKSLYEADENGNPIYKTKGFTEKEMGIVDTPQKAFDMLKRLGIEFSVPAQVSEMYHDDLVTKAEAIRSQIAKGSQPAIFNKQVNVNVKEDLDTLINIERDTTIDYIENSHMNIENNLVYDVVLNSYLSTIANDLVNFKTRDALFAENPHLDPINNIYTKNSLLLARRFNKNGKEVDGIIYDKNGKLIEGSLIFQIHEGSKEEESELPLEFQDLGEPDQLRVHLNRGFEGAYPLLRPADNSIERYLDFGSPLLSDTQIGINTHIDQMMLYLRDELARSLDIMKGLRTGSVEWLHHEANAKDGIMISIMSINPEIKKAIDIFLSDPNADVDDFFGDSMTREALQGHINTYFDSRTGAKQEDGTYDGFTKLLLDYGIIEEIPDDPTKFVNNGLNISNNAATLAHDVVRSAIKNYLINDTVSNIEQTKIFTGDPINYKNVSDQFKRHSGMVGTKKMSAVYEQVNQWIEENFLRTDRAGGLYRNGKPILRTAIFGDIIVESKYYEAYVKAISEKKAEPYFRMEEGDGQGYITIDEWREMLFRAGDWSFGVGSLEDLYQWEWQRAEGVEKPYYRGGEENGRVIDPTKLPVANPIKPQHMGPLAEQGFVMGMYKLSLFPILPSVTMTRDGYEGFPQLEALRQKMKSSGTGIAAFHTANKVGTKLRVEGERSEIQQLYDEDGNFAFTESDFVTQDTYYKYWGIQQDMGAKTKKKVVSGTQMAKQIVNGLYENGKLREGYDPQLGILVEEYKALNKQRIKIGMEQLIDSLGLVEKDGVYEIDDITELIDKFKKEAEEREMPDNIIDAITNLKIGNGVDSLINHEKIENILMSIADAMSTSQKRSGSPKVQVSNAIGKRVKTIINNETGQVWDSSELNFYEKVTKDGKTIITQMEVYLPSYLKGLTETSDLSKVNPKLLSLIGFRIPTQGLNSIESIVIKGFLPKGAGDSIIVPSEIVAKTGSDFDIDKLNIYYPNVYYNSKGDPVYIELQDTESMIKTYSEYKDTLESKLSKRIISASISKTIPQNVKKYVESEISRFIKDNDVGINEIITNINERISFTENILRTGTQSQKDAYRNVAEVYDVARDNLLALKTEIENGTSTEFEPMTRREFTKRAVENRISEVQKDIVTHPDNFEQLINPISSEELSEEAKKIRVLQGKDAVEKPEMRNIAEREYLMEVARRFIGGKQAVGITAIYSTFDILSKMENVSIVPEIKVYRNKQNEIIPTEIRMPHNKNEAGDINLSKIEDASGEGIIPERFSQWINAAVDAATNPFMFDLNSGPNTLSTVLYLTMAGVPLKHLTRFMSQPIVIEYINMRQKWESQMMEGNTESVTTFSPFGGISTKVQSKKKFREEIIQRTKKKYREGTSSFGEYTVNEEFTVAQLEANIKQGARNTMTESYANSQLQILDDFLRYQDTAKKLGDAMSGINYDTKAGGKNTSELDYRLRSTKKVGDEAVLNNYESILKTGFISPYYNAVRDLRDVLNPLFVTLNDEQIQRQFNKLYAVLFDDRNNIPTDKKIRVVDKFKQSFLTHLLLTRPYTIDDKLIAKDGSPTLMTSQVDRLFKGDNSIAQRLKKEIVKREEEGLPEMELLKYLDANINDSVLKDFINDTDHIITSTKKLDNIDTNRLTNEWRQLLTANNVFAQDLVLATLLQYGILNAPFTFTNLIPFEIYGEIMNSVLNHEKGTPDVERSALYDNFYDRFFLNNYDDDAIVPKKKKGSERHKAYPFYKEYELKDEYIGFSKTQLSKLRGEGVFVNKSKPIVRKADVTDETMFLTGILKNYREKRLLLNYSVALPAVDPIDINDPDAALITKTKGDEYYQVGPSLYNISVRWGIQDTGFFNKQTDELLLKQELRKRGFTNITVKRARSGNLFLSDDRGMIKVSRLKQEYAQVSPASQESPDAAINEKVKRWLDKMGIRYENVEQITDRTGAPIDAIAKADMLNAVVQVAEEKADITTLSEEAAHFLVELLGDDNPLLKGMMNAVEGTTTYDEVVAEYAELYDNDEIMLKKEAVGKMIAKTIIRKEKVAGASRFQKWWDSAWRWLKRHLGRVSSEDIVEDLGAFAEAADIILGQVANGLQPIESLQPKIFYQTTDEQKKERDAIEQGFLDNRVSKNLAKEGGYVTAFEKVVRNRVSDYSKRFYDELFKGRVQEEEAKEYNKLLAQKGTIVHKYLEILGEALFAGKAVDMATVKDKVIKQLMNRKDQANEEFWDKTPAFFNLTGKQFGELRDGLKKLIAQVRAKQKRIDPNGEVKFFPELIIYDQYGDIGGTIDLAVLYSNASVGIYDYKTINFDETKTLPLYKEDAYNVQIGEYKRILKDAYGIKSFGETRIIPIDSQMTKTGLGFADLVMGSTDINNKERPYLEQIPVAKELTESADLNRSLEKLFVLYDQLRDRLSEDHRNEKLQVQVARVREGIANLQLKSDVSFMYEEIRKLHDDFEQRENLPEDDKFGLNNEYLGEVEQFIEAYKQFGINAMPTAKKQKNQKVVVELRQVAHMLETLEDRVNQKQTENSNRGENYDVAGSAPAESFMGQLFKRLHRFNRPVFHKLSKMVHEVADKVRKDVDALNAEINVKAEALDLWAKARGWNLQQAYDRIINPKNGNLTSKFRSDIVTDQREAAADKNRKWFLDNTQIEQEDGLLYYTGESLERFNRIKDEQFAYLDRSQDEDTARREKLKWARKYDITDQPFALFYKDNYFIKPQEKAENYSEDYNFMLQPGNEALLDYYDFYIRTNDDLAERTGKRIDSNFVAEVHTDMINKLTENGLQGIRGIWDSIKRGVELHEHDLSRGKIDLVTGKPVGGVPLFYSGKLRGRVDKAEAKRIEAEVADEFTKGTVAYDIELESRMKKAEYYAGTKSKSRDLSRSLSLFGDAAYSYQHLSNTEASARALISIMKSQGQETELVDAAGKKIVGKLTRRAAVMLGVPTSEIEAMEKFINLYWYGQTTQGDDFSFTVGGKQYSSIKFYQAILGFTSASALALKPVLAAGNAIGIKANYYMTGWEGRYYTAADIKRTHRDAVSGDVMYKAAISYFEPFTHDLSFRKANNLSVSKIARTLTFENLFILHRLGDEHIDRNITYSMMQRFGIDENGVVVHLRKLQNKEGADTRSLLDRSSIVDDKFVIEGLNEAQYIRFREMIQTAATGVKGNMSQEDKNLIGTTMMGQALMQFRNWMPGLIEKRFKGLEYDDLFDDFDVGRFRVFYGELTAKGTIPKLGAFTKALGEMVTMNVYSKGGEKTADNPLGRNINMEVTKKFYDKYRAANPTTTLTMAEFVELRVDKLQGMAKELQIYLAFSLIVFAGKAMLPDEQEEALTKASRLMAQNGFRVTQRGLLELSFFFDPQSAATILKTPLPSLRFFVNLQSMFTNTIDETRDVIFGEDSKLEKTPRFYYFSKTVPVVSAAVDFFDMFDTYNKERGY